MFPGDAKHSGASHTPLTNGHVAPNAATWENPATGRRKRTGVTLPAHTHRPRAANKTSTHTTVPRPSSPQDTPLPSPVSDPGEGTPRRGRPHKPRLSSTPRPNRLLTSLVADPDARRRRRVEEREEVRDAPAVKRPQKARAEKAELPRSQRIRTRLVLEEAEPEEPVSSSDLSIELSVQEETLPLTHTHALEDEEEEEEEEEEEMPSFLQRIRQKPSSIGEGMCVWCKLRKFPFWPAMVKSVNHKTKKASIVFIDEFLLDRKRVCKGLWVSLRTLKPYDCEESQHLTNLAKEFGGSIHLSLALISDYNIRIGCGSFVGSIIDYIADDISQPLRSEFSKASSALLCPTQYLLEQDGGCALQELGEEHAHPPQGRKKVLPDRMQAARNRSNQRLVDFIVRRKGAQDRILAVIRGRTKSRWLQDLRSCSRSAVGPVYLEDEEQVEVMFQYLEELWESVAKANRRTHTSDRIRYILDVLFPEALIYAISKVDSVSLDKAEEIYRQGPQHSNRERQQFDLIIEQQMKLKTADL